jgi:hypothetical protein
MDDLDEDTLSHMFRQLQPTEAPAVRRFILREGQPLPPEYHEYRRRRPDGLAIVRVILARVQPPVRPGSVSRRSPDVDAPVD